MRVATVLQKIKKQTVMPHLHNRYPNSMEVYVYNYDRKIQFMPVKCWVLGRGATCKCLKLTEILGHNYCNKCCVV